MFNFCNFYRDTDSKNKRQCVCVCMCVRGCVYAHGFWYDGYHTTGCCLIIDWHPDLPTDRDASHIMKAYVHRTRTTFVNSTIKSLLPLKKKSRSSYATVGHRNCCGALVTCIQAYVALYSMQPPYLLYQRVGVRPIGCCESSDN